MSMVTRSTFVERVRSYIGTPFAHQGRLPGVGLDCPGPLICACRELGLKPPAFDVTGYPRVPDGLSLKAVCEEHMQPVPLADLQPADVVLVAWQHGAPQHLGIVADYPGGHLSMVHAEQRHHGKVIETRLVFGRLMRFVAGFAVPGVA